MTVFDFQVGHEDIAEPAVRVELPQFGDMFEPVAVQIAKVEEDPLYQPFLELLCEQTPGETDELTKVVSEWHKVDELEDLLAASSPGDSNREYHRKVRTPTGNLADSHSYTLTHLHTHTHTHTVAESVLMPL
jgi:hypothetical protein